MKRSSVEEATSEIEKWVAYIPADENICRIGWNAEAAAVAALRLVSLSISIPEKWGAEPCITVLDPSFSWDSCRAMLDKLWEDEDSYLFAKPVQTPRLLRAHPKAYGPWYCAKKASGLYGEIPEVIQDVELTFCNAMAYNVSGSAAHNAARRMLGTCKELCGVLEIDSQNVVQLSSACYLCLNDQVDPDRRARKNIITNFY
ncbi:hypothetical protein SELMODRAFT_414695 [Selaginella moellendorffii]|uniref:Bromo domain-containing protein n=1 Tax=Selaginella moellendorffii TaxID=88036 RepID=D8RTM0_SELML|nr:hypothetical protein SELMODRAFT_414695 [Selaginella moellendorffii]